jgi:hypothetical protein
MLHSEPGRKSSTMQLSFDTEIVLSMPIKCESVAPPVACSINIAKAPSWMVTRTHGMRPSTLPRFVIHFTERRTRGLVPVVDSCQ